MIFEIMPICLVSLPFAFYSFVSFFYFSCLLLGSLNIFQFNGVWVLLLLFLLNLLESSQTFSRTAALCSEWQSTLPDSFFCVLSFSKSWSSILNFHPLHISALQRGAYSVLLSFGGRLLCQLLDSGLVVVGGKGSLLSRFTWT